MSAAPAGPVAAAAADVLEGPVDLVVAGCELLEGVVAPGVGVAGALLVGVTGVLTVGGAGTLATGVLTAGVLTAGVLRTGTLTRGGADGDEPGRETLTSGVPGEPEPGSDTLTTGVFSSVISSSGELDDELVDDPDRDPDPGPDPPRARAVADVNDASTTQTPPNSAARERRVVTRDPSRGSR